MNDEVIVQCHCRRTARRIFSPHKSSPVSCVLQFNGEGSTSGCSNRTKLLLCLALGSFLDLLDLWCHLSLCVVVGGQNSREAQKQAASHHLNLMLKVNLRCLVDGRCCSPYAHRQIIASSATKRSSITTRVNQHLHRHRYLIQLDRIHDGSGPPCDEDVGPERPLRRRRHRRPQCLGESKPDGDASTTTPFQEYPQDGPCIL